MAQKRSKKAGAAKAGAAEAAESAPTPASDSELHHNNRPPPQAEGTPQRPAQVGAQPGYQKPNIALQVLRDPVARSSRSRVYSGQARGWRR